MPLRKIRDFSRPCMDREHNPPAHIVLTPGVYEHTCPACGNKIVFTVNGVYCHAAQAR